MFNKSQNSLYSTHACEYFLWNLALDVEKPKLTSVIHAIDLFLMRNLMIYSISDDLNKKGSMI